jgi:DnaJ-class molecular chaperone
MGMSRKDVAAGKPPCEDCQGVGRVPGMRPGRYEVSDCRECKGLGFVMPKANA